MLSQHLTKATPSHVATAKNVVKYLKGCKNLSICFSMEHNSKLSAFLNFPIANNSLTSLANANWGLQDTSVPKPDALTN
eukprot:8382447-Ditylum_brightwellii.AAC.1